MTEEEAKSKWCPFARCVAGEDAPGGAKTSSQTPTFNRVALPTGCVTPHGAKCIGSECMAWRRSPAPAGDLIQAIKDYRAEHGCDLLTAKNAVEEARRHKSPHGYCGLAGAPQ